MPWPKKGASLPCQLGLQDKGHTIKELVVSWVIQKNSIKPKFENNTAAQNSP